MSIKKAIEDLNCTLCCLDYAEFHFDGGDPQKAFKGLADAMEYVEDVIKLLEKSEGGS